MPRRQSLRELPMCEHSEAISFGTLGQSLRAGAKSIFFGEAISDDHKGLLRKEILRIHSRNDGTRHFRTPTQNLVLIIC